MNDLVLYIGDKNLSSWSLRPWLALARSGLAFREVVIPLNRPETHAAITAVSPSGRVPVLVENGVAIWESLAICERIAELAPAAKLLPDAPTARAVARAVSCEMHAGFAALRRECPMNLTAGIEGLVLSDDAKRDVARVQAVWRMCREQFGALHGGPFLFGDFTVADAMYAPVATRFRTYGLARDAVADAWIRAIYDVPEMKRWIADAEAEVAHATRR